MCCKKIKTIFPNIFEFLKILVSLLGSIFGLELFSLK